MERKEGEKMSAILELLVRFNLWLEPFMNTPAGALLAISACLSVPIGFFAILGILLGSLAFDITGIKIASRCCLSVSLAFISVLFVQKIIDRAIARNNRDS